MQKVMNLLIETCKKTTELIDKQMLTPLTFKEKMQLQGHKALCKTCSAYESQSKIIDALIQKWFSIDSTNVQSKLDEQKKRIIIDEINKL